MTNTQLLTETALRISGVNPRKCMKCGKCSGSCPAYEQMEYHPHQFVAMVDNGDIQALLDSDASFKCLTCYACTERCPRDVRPQGWWRPFACSRFASRARTTSSPTPSPQSWRPSCPSRPSWPPFANTANKEMKRVCRE